VLSLLLARRHAGTLPAFLRHPAAFGAVTLGLAVAAGWQWGSARLDVRDAIAYERTTRAAFFAPLIHEIRRRSPRPVRVEIAFTGMHYEALWVARAMPLARGWLRQLDRAHNALFYEGRLTHARYERWLRRNGVSWVALASGPLDHSTRAEARIIRSGTSYLREVWDSPDWRLFEVISSPPLATGPARVVRVDGDGVVVHMARPGNVLLRFRHTRYWRVTAGSACIRRAPGGWTEVLAERRGRIALEARLGALWPPGERRRCRSQAPGA
jgi:hypothetical protein